MDKEELEESLSNKTTFKVRRLVCQSALEHSLNIDADRVEIDGAIDRVIRAIFHVATLEDEVFDYPENFLTRLGAKWQTFKEQKFPRWLKKRVPNVTNRVWAVSKFPELNLPREFQSSEFVHFRVIQSKKI